MKINSGLSGYYYPNRTVETERKQEETAQRETPAATRSTGALTGSSTFPVSSLANALWVMEVGEAGAAAEAIPAQQDWVQGLYEEFA